ncbi:MAG: hypothetical protein ACJ75J_14970 [Cytophagaceae bacterium]
MKNIFKPALMLLTAITLLTACSKDKSIERQIQKKDGVWNIDNFAWNVVEQTSSPSQNIFSGSTSNAGTFTFDNNGTGKYSYTVADTIQRTGTFSWTVDNEKVSMVSATQSVNYSNYSVTQKAVTYSGADVSKTKMTVTGSEVDQYSSGNVTQFTISGTMTLSKK